MNMDIISYPNVEGSCSWSSLFDVTKVYLFLQNLFRPRRNLRMHCFLVWIKHQDLPVETWTLVHFYLSVSPGSHLSR